MFASAKWLIQQSHNLKGIIMALDKTGVLNATCKYGALESSGVEQDSARVALTWTTSGSDSVVSGTEAFTGTANQPVDAVGFYDAATGGNYYGNAPLTGDTAYNSDGKYNVTALSVTG